MKLNFYDEQVPDATTLLHFRHLLEEHKIGEKMFAAIRNVLEQNGYMMTPTVNSSPAVLQKSSVMSQVVFHIGLDQSIAIGGLRDQSLMGGSASNQIVSSASFHPAPM